MAKILSQEEIDALLSSVSESTVSGGEQGQKQKVVLYDFKHPNLISKEQMRLLEAIHESLCRDFSVFLSAQLRMIVEMNLLAIDQILYSEFVLSIAPPSCLYVCNVDNPNSHFVLEMSPQLAIFIVERLFGGPGSPVTDLRPISVIEQKVMTRVINRFLKDLEQSWELVTKFHADIQRYESNPEFVQIVPSSEPVVVVSMEVKIHGHTTLLNISYPYMWVSAIISSPEVQDKILYGSIEASENEQKLIQENLMETPTVVNVRLGKNRISIRDFLELQVGDVIQLENRTDKLLPVYINNKHAFNGVVGLRKNHYAVRIETIEEGEKHESK